MGCGLVFSELLPQLIAFFAGFRHGILAGTCLDGQFFVLEGRCFSGIFELRTLVTVRHADILSVRYSTPLWTRISLETSRLEFRSRMCLICIAYLRAM